MISWRFVSTLLSRTDQKTKRSSVFYWFHLTCEQECWVLNQMNWESVPRFTPEIYRTVRKECPRRNPEFQSWFSVTERRWWSRSWCQSILIDLLQARKSFLFPHWNKFSVFLLSLGPSLEWPGKRNILFCCFSLFWFWSMAISGLHVVSDGIQSHAKTMAFQDAVCHRGTKRTFPLTSVRPAKWDGGINSSGVLFVPNQPHLETVFAIELAISMNTTSLWISVYFLVEHFVHRKNPTRLT